MRCPACGHNETDVVDSRSTDQGRGIRRRRECKSCKRRFTTYESVGEDPIFVRKKDGAREPFSREKLLAGLVTACRKRPVTLETLEEFVGSVEARLRADNGREVESARLGEIVLEGLREIDPVAYVRFASVYREFDSVEAFEEIIKGFKMEKVNR